ncbi:N-acetylhexosaminidase [Basidiobolus meristosporus CBS 931.73]|uniref:Beta-hexosaminidase n=1 Tax=Basidiobolus meristosporus CBS 931.73 TaxID=1314790 RepID=A0A1Y1Z1N2_9FUNG|nr:N-acetylhexosaminidase [Basidiobolus meristosporus CBS 931.73]|eukprot:ORY04213.1 N-acetylhexosaminidase [Basidiobolus meristosporus CBS 931.73]
MAWVWPLPEKMEIGESILTVRHGFDIDIEAKSGRDILRRAVKRYKKIIFNTGEYGDLLHPVTKTVFPTPTPNVPIHEPIPEAKTTRIKGLVIRVNGKNTDLNIETDESYKLDVPADGSEAVIEAETVYGALRGLESFSQLVHWSSDVNQHRIPMAPVKIEDKPAFPHRGFLIDTSRNYLPIADDIKRILDGMSYNKLNIFHWHVIDQHSFPLMTKTYPELAIHGAYTKKWIYDEDDVREIVRYAKDRAIRVIPEFDIPGHAYSWGLAMPDIVNCMNMQPDWDTYAAEPNSGQLDIINPKTDEVVQNFLKEVAQWFDDDFIHIGGDEVNMKCWEITPGYPEYLEKHNKTMEDVLLDFVIKTHNWVRDNKKIPITWQEALTSHNISMEKDVAVQVWLSPADAIDVVRAGHRVISSSYERWYLDCGHGGWISDNEGNSWCDPHKSWQKAYNYDITANMTAEEAKLVIGGEAPAWAEQIDTTNIDRTLWPRGAAVAEVLWSGIKLEDGTYRKTGDVFPRIHEQRARMVDRGIRAVPLQPLWCARNPRNC